MLFQTAQLPQVYPVFPEPLRIYTGVLGQIGDIVMFSATLRRLKQLFPNSHVTCAVSARYREAGELLAGLPYVDRLFVTRLYFENLTPLLFQPWERGWPLDLRGEDEVGEERQHHLVLPTRPRHRRMPWWEYAHQVEELAHMVGVPGPVERRTEIRIPEGTAIPPTWGGRIVLHNDPHIDPVKAWPWEHVRRLVALVGPQQVLLLGNPGPPVAGALVARGHTTLAQAAAVIAQARAYVGVDSGLMWIAGSVQVPVVGLYGTAYIPAVEASLPGRALLTTVTGPTGCQTGYQYDAFTRLTGITNPNGYQTGYGYDAAGRTTFRSIAGAGRTTYSYGAGWMSVQDALNNVTLQVLDGNGQIVGVTNPLGKQVSLTRNASTFETSRMDPLGNTTTTLYDASSMPVATVDALSYVTTYTRDGFHNPTSVQTADGTITTNVWGYAGSSFDATGARRRIQAVIDPLGYATSYAYNGRGQLLSVQNALGYLTTYGYDAFGNRVSEQNALGYVTTYGYDLAGNVVSTTNPLGNVWTASYDPQNRPLTSTDPLGNTSTVAYDSVGNKVVQINPLGYRTSWAYNVFDLPVSVTDPLGNVSTNVYDVLGRNVAQVDPLGYATTTVYDASGKAVASVNALGYIATSVYDVAGRNVGQLDPLGFMATQVYDGLSRVVAGVDALGYRTSYGYDVVGRQVSTTDALGYVSTSVYDLAGRGVANVDALGYSTTTIYDASDRSVASVDALGRRSTSIHDAAGRNVALVDPLGFRSTTNYDAAGRNVSSQDARGYVSTTVYDAASRSVASVDALGYVSSTIYDAASRRIAGIDALGHVSTSVYDVASNTIAYVDAIGNRSSYGYDARGLAVNSQDALGHISTTAYDPLGRVSTNITALVYCTSAVYDPRSQQIARQDALGFLHTSLYDAIGRTLASIDPLGFMSTYLYNGRGEQVAFQDALGNRTSRVYDSVGRLLAQQDARGFLTSFVYDAAGEQLAVADASGHRTSSLYDLRGMLQSSQDPPGLLTTYAYDPAGNTIMRTDARCLPTTYTIDPLNRTSGTLYTDGTRVTSTWDAVGLQVGMQDVTGAYSYGYDMDGRQVSVTYPSGKALTYGYDAVGNRALLRDPDGGLTTYAYDPQNRLTSILNPYAELTTVSYDALDREARKTLGNGMAVSHAYDPAGKETFLGNFRASGTALAIFTNTYDAAGNCLSVLELDGTYVTNAYDATYQLVSEQRSGANSYNTTYVYDGLGNRLVKSDSGQITTYSYNAANALALVQPPTGQPTTSSYDANGNLLLDNAGGVLTTYSWDGENRLTGVTASTGLETYVYSADGLRKRKVTGAGTTNFVWDGQNLLLEADASQSTQVRYTDDPGIWGGLASQRRAGVSSFYGFDSQGSARVLVSVSGLVTDSYSYKAFGEELATSGSTANAMRYVGQYGYYRDTAIRQYVWEQYLNVMLGRWISRDLMQTGINGYIYDGNMPMQLHYTPHCTCPPNCPTDSNDCYKPSCLRKSAPRYTDKHGKCHECCGKNAMSWLDVRELARKQIFAKTDCLKSTLLPKSSIIGLLADVVACIAYGESNFDPRCSSYFTKTKEGPDVFGLYQIDTTQWKNCDGGNSKMCDATASTNVAIKMIISVCSNKGECTFLSGKKIPVNNMYDALRCLFGAFNGSDFKKCITDHGNFASDQLKTWLSSITCCCPDSKCPAG